MNVRLRERVRRSEAYRSVVRGRHVDTPRGRALATFQNFFLHVYPVKVPRRVLSWRSTFRLGFIASVLFMVLLVSGFYLMFFYVPTAPDAYVSMHEIHTSVAFGQFVRNVHRWAAHLMVVVVALHMARVFYAGAYKPPRQFNWVIGVWLLVLTLGLSFTGYLLPWDQLAYWAVTVGGNIAGYVPLAGEETQRVLLAGVEVSEKTLLRFYVLHVYALPVLLTVGLAVHVWRVRKDGWAGATPPVSEPQGAPAEVE